MSRYAERSRMEQEAEWFAFYHRGGDRRPLWIRSWGSVLHEELGLDMTPITAAGRTRKGYRTPGFYLPAELLDEVLAGQPEAFHPATPTRRPTAAKAAAGGGVREGGVDRTPHLRHPPQQERGQRHVL